MKKVNPKWFRHEALHTSSVCLEILDDHLQNHRYYDSEINPEFNKNIDEAISALGRAYQACNQLNEVKNKIKVEHD